MCGISAILVSKTLPRVPPDTARRRASSPRVSRLTAQLLQLGDTKATTAAAELHESIYYIQHVCIRLVFGWFEASAVLLTVLER